MRILLVNHFPLEGSGSGTYTKNLALQLAKLGHEISIILPENRPVTSPWPSIRLRPVYFTGDLPIDGALPFNFPCFTTHPRSDVTFGMLSFDEISIYMKAFEKTLAAEISRFRPDIIHSQHIWMLSFLATQQGLPCVITAHGTGIMGYEKWPALHMFAEDAVSGCDRLVTISRDNRSLVLKYFPQVEKKLHLIPNSYNESIFYPEHRDPREVLARYEIPYQGEEIVLFVGKLTEFKGVDTLLDAAKEYEAKGNILTLIVGSGALDASLRVRAKRLGLKNLHFLGNQPQDALRQLYNIAGVFAMPSRREPFGLVALEAMACGTPVVASNEGGLPDFVTPAVGTLVEANQPHSLAAAIRKELLKGRRSPHRREAIATYAKAHYSQEKLVEALLQVYRLAMTREDKGGQSA